MKFVKQINDMDSGRRVNRMFPADRITTSCSLSTGIHRGRSAGRGQDGPEKRRLIAGSRRGRMMRDITELIISII